MIAIIPVAGVGSKLRPHTHTQPKALLPVAGKPIIAHIIDSIAKGGITDFVLILGYMRSQIQEYIFSTYKDTNLNIQFVVQNPREGSAHALLCAQQLIQQETDLLIALGDTIVNMNLSEFLAQPCSSVGVHKVENPTAVGVAELGKDGMVRQMIEKPRFPKSNLGLVGVYKIANVPLFVESLEHLIKEKIMTNGEYHLTDALAQMLHKGEKFSAVEVDSWFDCGKKESLLEANATLLNLPGFERTETASFPGTIIIQPVRIGEQCQIRNAIIGPNVVIGSQSTIENCVVKNSIIGSYSRLDSLILESSLVGNDSTLKGASQKFNVGDHTEIDLSE